MNKMRHIHMCFLLVMSITTLSYILLQRPYLNRIDTFDDGKNKTISDVRSIIHIVVVACRQRAQETLVMIKSAILFNDTEYLKFLIFTEDLLKETFREKLTDWKGIVPNVFDFELLPLKFPKKRRKEFETLFKPCAAQRLFLPSVLTKVDSLIYVDTDVLFLSPASDAWKLFKRFNESQITALAAEHENENVGWYNRFARHPFYGKLGVNSGVALMNLTRMRKFKWEKHVLPIYKEYKLRITWGDQDIINILFYFHPDKLHLMPCEYNYRSDHCMYTSRCNTTLSGVKVIHGNRGYFHVNKQPLFKAIYSAIESFQLGTDPYTNFLLPLRSALSERTVNESSCGKIAQDSLLVANRLFGNQF